MIVQVLGCRSFVFELAADSDTGAVFFAGPICVGMKRSHIPVVVGLGCLVVVGLVGFSSPYWFQTLVSNAVEMALFGLITVGVPFVVLCVTCWWWSQPLGLRRVSREELRVLAVLLVVSLVWLGFGARSLHRSRFETARWWGENTSVVAGDHPVWDSRLPYAQAETMMRRSVGDVQGELSALTYMLDAENVPVWTAFVTTRESGFGDRRNISEVVQMRNDGTVRHGKFNGRVGSPHGFWKWNLNALVAGTAPGLTVSDDADVYGYLDGSGDPVLVVPVLDVDSDWWFRPAVRANAGVVVVDRDAKFSHVRTPGSAGVLGPTVGFSNAAKTREALNTRHGFVLFGNPDDPAGETLELAGDSGKSDQANMSERLLIRGNHLFAVTPLTRRGSSNSVVGWFEVDMQSDGATPHAVLYQPVVATVTISAFVDRVTQLYGAELGFVSSGTEISEANPTSSGVVELTVLRGDKSVFRVTGVTGERSIQEMCVYSPDGRKVRCDQETTNVVPPGSLRQNVPGAEVQVSPSADLSGVSTADLLAELGRRVR